MKTAAVHNLGCKVNAYEAEAMGRLLEEAGYRLVPFSQKADVYIVNTCSVTNIADHKSRQMLHKARRQNPDAILVAAGCYVQTGAEELKKDMGVDILLGNNHKAELPAMLSAFQKDREGGRLARLSDISHPSAYEELKVPDPAGHTRAFLKVQDGCNQFCSYCIIPYARGRIRSRRPEDVEQEVRRLAENGFLELVLTGIHLSSYGKDLEDGSQNLLSLIGRIHDIAGIRRIRLGSLEPGIITEDFAASLAACHKVCPHFHLSLQSGSDTVLKRMNRRYSRSEYLEKCRILRRHFRDPAITTDIIVGFPGESEEEFADSIRIVEEAGFADVHIFKFSRRKGTPADRMPDQITEAVKTERARALSAICDRQREAFAARYRGRMVEVLLEGKRKRDGRLCYEGYTPEYLKVAVPAREGDPDLTNQIKTVEFSGCLY